MSTGQVLPMVPARRARLPLGGWVLLAALVVLAAYWWQLFAHESEERDRALQQASARSQQAAELLSAQVRTFFQSVDSTLLLLATQYRREGASPVFNATVRDTLNTYAQGALTSFSVLDADGTVVYSTLDGSMGLNFAKGEHVASLLKRPQAGMYVSAPVLGSVSKQWSLYFSRAIVQDGQLRGVVVAVVSPRYLANLLDPLTQTAPVAFSLIRDDGRFLFRTPGFELSMIERMPLDRPYFARAQVPGEVLVFNDVVDDLPRVMGWSRVERAPVIVVAGLSESAVLAPVRDRHLIARGMGLVGSVVVVALSVLLAMVSQRLQQQGVEMQASQERLQLALDAGHLGLWDWHCPSGRIYCNDQTLHMLGYTREDVPRDVDEWVARFHPDDLPLARKRLIAHLKGVEPAYSSEHRMRHADGRWVWVLDNAKVTERDGDGRPLRVVGVQMDITERKHADEALAATRDQLKTIVKAIPDVLYECDLEGTYHFFHAPSSGVFYAPDVQRLGHKVDQLLPPGPAGVVRHALAEAALKGVSRGREYRMDLESGPQWFELTAVRKPEHEGEGTRVIVLVRNITERVLARQEAERMAFHDPLTDLANRRLLGARLEKAVQACARTGQMGAVMFLDLDKFKQLNDRHGHDVGDLLLVEVAQRLRANVRLTDTVARLGGDEFVVVFEELGSDPQAARALAESLGEKIRQALAQPYQLGGLRHETTASLGVALFPQPGLDSASLLKQADDAMYEAKAFQRGTLRFHAAA